MPPLSTIQPTLKDLVFYAVPRVAPAWYDVGLQLDIEPDVLDEIEKERADHSRKMFTKWLKGSSCSWQSVLNAVEKARGAKPMEDIRAAVVESIKAAQSSGEHACTSVFVSFVSSTHKVRKLPVCGQFLIPDISIFLTALRVNTKL